MTSALREPQPGDLIEIFRLGYEHWAIYVGDGFVIHLAPPSECPGAGFSSIFSVLCNRAVVKREPLEDVVGGCHYQINNLLDNKYIPLPVEVILNAAKERIGEEMPYNIVSKNCEHFVTDLRYGVPKCRQITTFATGGCVALVMGLLAVLGYSVLGKRRQNQ
ncbi:phospholipase A and acyltransferase 4 [Tamandua tetradactyla]|uniref:phospholipase A and acyltransferase 4 n=1 Tax=Tamandua tetradactyla TaxID=48850 RepID=UPI0040547680